MPQMLIDGAIEYEDGTPASESQVLMQMNLQCPTKNLPISHALYLQICELMEAHIPLGKCYCRWGRM